MSRVKFGDVVKDVKINTILRLFFESLLTALRSRVLNPLKM